MHALRPVAIDYAIDKFLTFVQVQKGNPKEVRLDAVDRFAEGVGVTPLIWEHLTGELDSVIDGEGQGELGWAIIGVLLGLYMREYDDE